MVDFLCLYIDTESAVRKIGLGYRDMLVLNVGRVWADLLYIPTVTRVQVHKETLRKAKPITVDDRVLVRRLREALKLRKKLGMSWSGSGSKAAFALLNHQPRSDEMTETVKTTNTRRSNLPYADTEVVTVVGANPHRAGTKDAAIFDKIVSGATVAQVREAGVSSSYVKYYVDRAAITVGAPAPVVEAAVAPVETPKPTKRKRVMTAEQREAANARRRAQRKSQGAVPPTQ